MAWIAYELLVSGSCRGRLVGVGKFIYLTGSLPMDGAVPSDWPKVVPNTQGLQRFIYHGTRDFMRRVSQHVSIGAAYKGEKKLDHYFVLVRQDE